MTNFSSTYRQFVRQTVKADRYWGFDVRVLARLEPFLSFLFFDWWKVDFSGLERLPKSGPAVIVGNQGSVLPWQALMLIYGIMSHKENPRRVHIVCDLDWIEDERLNAFLIEIGFVPYSSASMKRLFARDEIVAIFPEGIAGLSKPFSQRYRLQDFDWTRLLPAVEENVKIFPLASLGCDESVPLYGSSKILAKLLNMPFYPITPFFPWFPFPLNLASRPVKWSMSLMKEMKYEKSKDRDHLEDTTKNLAGQLQGEIQAELNRALRKRG